MIGSDALGAGEAPAVGQFVRGSWGHNGGILLCRRRQGDTRTGGPALRLFLTVLADARLGAGQQAADVGMVAGIHQHGNG